MTFYWKKGAFTGCELAGNREAQEQETLVADILDSSIMVRGARDRVAQFDIEKARVCCAQEHITQTLMSTRPTRLTVEQIVVAVCRLCVRQLKGDTWSYDLGYWALVAYAEQITTDRHPDETATQTDH